MRSRAVPPLASRRRCSPRPPSAATECAATWREYSTPPVKSSCQRYLAQPSNAIDRPRAQATSYTRAPLQADRETLALAERAVSAPEEVERKDAGRRLSERTLAADAMAKKEVLDGDQRRKVLEGLGHTHALC